MVIYCVEPLGAIVWRTRWTKRFISKLKIAFLVTSKASTCFICAEGSSGLTGVRGITPNYNRVEMPFSIFFGFQYADGDFKMFFFFNVSMTCLNILKYPSQEIFHPINRIWGPMYAFMSSGYSRYLHIHMQSSRPHVSSELVSVLVMTAALSLKFLYIRAIWTSIVIVSQHVMRLKPMYSLDRVVLNLLGLGLSLWNLS